MYLLSPTGRSLEGDPSQSGAKAGRLGSHPVRSVYLRA